MTDLLTTLQDTFFDWIERKLYTPHSVCGVGFMLAIDLLAFDAMLRAVRT
ncbi:hypothetical protein [Pseudomonas sp. NPDC087615]